MRLVILGAGSFAKELIWIVEENNKACKKNNSGLFFDLLGFIDEDKNKEGLNILGYPVFGELKTLSFWNSKNEDFVEYEYNKGKEEISPVHAVCSVGKAKGRASLVMKARKLGYDFIELIHPGAVISNRAKVGEGTVVMPGAVVTVDVELGDHVMVNKLCSIGHDSKIGDYCTLAPGAKVGGNVIIEEGCDIGMNASIIQSVKIGKETTIGAGAVVIDDIPAGCTAVGVPAKVVGDK